MHTSRIFIAVPLPSTIQSTLAQWKNDVGSNCHFRKWVHPQDYHITLQFLGSVDKNRISALQEALVKIKLTSFTITMNNIGYFGTPRAPKILWVNTLTNQNQLQQIHEMVTEQTKLLHFPIEARDFHPHVTLARDYSGNTPFSIDHLPKLSPLSFEVKQFSIMQSHLGKQPMYSTVQSFNLSTEPSL